MKSCLSPLSLSLLLLLPSALIAQESSFPGVETLMTAEEYQAAGIDKLTPAEREALNTWLIRYTAEDSEVMRNTDEEVIQAAEVQRTISRISGDFNGWSGDTIFRLDNGQVWQQRRRGNYKHIGDSHPEVIITKNFLGFYRLELPENGKAVQVKRIK